MSVAQDLAALFERDLTRLLQQLDAFAGKDVLWECPPGIANSSGNLILHLEGNLREYVCRLLGGLAYRRARDQEFSRKNVPVPELIAGIEEIRLLVPGIIGQLSDEQLQAVFPENPLGSPISVQRYLIHLHGHLNYHLGQIDYLRRFLTGDTAVAYATL